MQERRYVGFWLRFAAKAIDSIVIWALSAFFRDRAMFMQGVLTLLNFAIYQSITGQSIGKKILGIRILKDTGEPITFGTGVLRYFAEILSAIIVGIGYLMVAWSPTKQGLHDKIAKTIVIKE